MTLKLFIIGRYRFGCRLQGSLCFAGEGWKSELKVERKIVINKQGVLEHWTRAEVSSTPHWRGHLEGGNLENPSEENLF